MRITVVGARLRQVMSGLLLLGAPSGHGQGGNEAWQKQPAPAKATVFRELSRAQLDAARLGTADGFEIEWEPRLATPTSIRGRAVGQRKAFSGGTGLVPRGAGSFSHDAVAVMDNLSRFYRIRNAAAEFAVRRIDRDALGFHHVRLAQRHQGRPVFGGEVTVHFDAAGSPYQVSGRYVPEIETGIIPTKDAEGALRFARNSVAGVGQQSAMAQGKPSLVIFALDAEPRLAYAVTLVTRHVKSGPGHWRCWIDAQDGTVLLRFNDVHRIAPPTAQGTQAVIRGNILAGEGGSSLVVTGWQENTGVYYLHNPDQHWLIYNAAPAGWPDFGTYAHRGVDDWNDSDPTAMSLARNFDTVQRYFRERHGRASFDGLNALVRVNAHVGNELADAYWHPAAQQFYFGDGNGVEADPFGALDICAHEYTHAVIEHSAGLIYAYESGALNESFCDILAACVEFHAQPDGRAWYPDRTAGTADWLAGEDAWRASVALRDLRNPHNAATVGAGNEQPSRYRGTFWYRGPGDNGGVHFNSGVQNFFFHLLSEGGTGTNDGIPFHVAGIGITNAARVAYRALTVYCTPNTDYPAARGAWLAAATDLNPAWVSHVSAAWSAVGLDALHVVPAGPMILRGPVGGPFVPAAASLRVFNRGAEPLAWSATTAQPWINAVPAQGAIPGGGAVSISLELDATAAAAFARGLYSNEVAFSHNAASAMHRREVKLLVGQPDYHTEVFDEADNDLDFQRWTFTPEGSGGSYAVCREAATAFPTEPAGGVTVFLTDDSYERVTLTGTNTVALYGRRTNVFFIGSNGYLTIGTPDFSYNESLPSHFARPRVAACFDDLDPGDGGAVSWKQTSDRVAVTFMNVPEYGSGAAVNFQIELHFDGIIRITCLGIGVGDGVAGLSAGEGIPPGFVESDLTSYASCASVNELKVTIDGTQCIISWPSAFPGRLESATELDAMPGRWTPLVPHPPILQSAGFFWVTLPTMEGARFFRWRSD